MAKSRAGVSFTIKPNAPSQYAGFNFNSLCIFNGKCLGFNEDGVFSLFDADYDSYVNASNKTNITAYFKPVRTDYGIPNQKRARRYFMGCEADGDIQITQEFDEVAGQTITATPSQSANLQESIQINGRRDEKGRYHTAKISNVSGSKFSVDSMDGVFTVLPRKPSGS